MNVGLSIIKMLVYLNVVQGFIVGSSKLLFKLPEDINLLFVFI